VRHLLKPVEAGHHHEKKGFFGWFNRTFTTASGSYQGMVAHSQAHGPLPDHLPGDHRRRGGAVQAPAVVVPA
jgi:hypothetical protein